MKIKTKRGCLSLLLLSMIGICGCEDDITEYTITYDANGATTGETFTKTKQKGLSVTIAEASDLAKTGKAFRGWNTEPDGTGTTYRPGTRYYTDESLTLYAMWTGKSGYAQIVFELNGGTLAVDSIQEKRINQSYTFPSASRKGYAFLGWATRDNSYDDISIEESVTPKDDSQTFTYRAVWSILGDMYADSLSTAIRTLRKASQKTRLSFLYSETKVENPDKVYYYTYTKATGIHTYTTIDSLCLWIDESGDVMHNANKNYQPVVSAKGLFAEENDEDRNSFTEIDVTYMGLETATSAESLFENCRALESVVNDGVGTLSLRNSNFKKMFKNCTSLETIDVRQTYRSNYINYLDEMFYGCTSLTTIYDYNSYSSNGYSYPESSKNMFYGCINLVGGNGTKYDSSHTDAEYARMDNEYQKGYFTDYTLKNN